MADGVKYYFHDQRPETKMVDGVDVHDFCTYSTTYSQTYPFLMVAEQYEDSAVDRYVESVSHIWISHASRDKLKKFKHGCDGLVIAVILNRGSAAH
jgi:hypothetical protein